MLTFLNECIAFLKGLLDLFMEMNCGVFGELCDVVFLYNVCTFCSNAVLSIMTTALFLSALAVVKLFFCKMSFI